MPRVEPSLVITTTTQTKLPPPRVRSTHTRVTVRDDDDDDDDDDDGDATIASTAHGPSAGGEDHPTDEIRGRGAASGNHDGETGASSTDSTRLGGWKRRRLRFRFRFRFRSFRARADRRQRRRRKDERGTDETMNGRRVDAALLLFFSI